MIIVHDIFMMTPPSQTEPQKSSTENTSQPTMTPFSVDFSSPPETIVVPPQGGEDQNAKEGEAAITPSPIEPVMPNIPSGEVPPPDSAPGTTETKANPWPKRILILVLLFVIGIGAIFAGRMVLTQLTTPKEVILTYWGLWEPEGVINPIISEFEANNPTIKVQYTRQSPKQYRQRLQTAIDSGSGPDIFRFHNTWVPMLKNQLAAVPEDVMSPATFATTYYPVATNDLVAGSTIYGLPLMFDGLALFYNEDLFAAAGITAPPATWEELLAMVPKIAKPDGNGFSVSAIALGTTSNIENFSDILALMFMQNGANLGNLAGTESEETLSFYKKFATSTDPVYTWNDTMDNSMYAFANGKVAMIFAPSWRAFDIVEMAKQVNPNLQFKVAPVPQLPGNTVTWASYWVEGVSEKSANKKAAWEFIKFLTSKETMMKMYTSEGNVRLFGEPYSRVDMADLIIEAPYVGPYIRQAKDSRSFPLASRTWDEGLNDKMMKYLENAVNALGQGSSPEAEVETLQKGFSQVLSQYGLVTTTAPANQQ